MDSRQPHDLSRRNAIKMAIAGVASIAATGTILAGPSVITRSRTTPKQIIVRDSGGLFSQRYREVFYEPFAKKTGIKVIGVASDEEPSAQIRAMVKAKEYLWDMASLGQAAILFLTSGKECFLEEHGLDNEPVVSSISPQFRSIYGVGTHIYSTVLAYRTDVFKTPRAVPKSWRDLWDVNNFRGRRGLRKHPFETIELALMADGVSPGNVYPCDLDRAFQSLDRIKPHIAVWWRNGAQVEQLLKSGEVDLLQAGTCRTQLAIESGAPFAFSWDQHIYGCDTWAILKDTPNADICREFIKFASDPKRQAALAPYGIVPTQPEALKYISEKQARRLSIHPDNFKKGLYIDASYWMNNQDLAIERFNQWMLS